MTDSETPPPSAAARFVNPTREQVVQWCVASIRAAVRAGDHLGSGKVLEREIAERIVPPVPCVKRVVKFTGIKRLTAPDWLFTLAFTFENNQWHMASTGESGVTSYQYFDDAAMAGRYYALTFAQLVEIESLRTTPDTPAPTPGALEWRERFAQLLDIQRDAAKDGNPYDVGLYNGMLMMCCNVDNSEFVPMRCAPQPTPGARGLSDLQCAAVWTEVTRAFVDCINKGTLMPQSDCIETVRAALAKADALRGEVGV